MEERKIDFDLAGTDADKPGINTKRRGKKDKIRKKGKTRKKDRPRTRTR
jgi:hypothetical protein